MKLCKVNKLTIAKTFLLRTLYSKITHSAIITRQTTETIDNLKCGDMKRTISHKPTKTYLLTCIKFDSSGVYRYISAMSLKLSILVLCLTIVAVSGSSGYGTSCTMDWECDDYGPYRTYCDLTTGTCAWKKGKRVKRDLN